MVNNLAQDIIRGLEQAQERLLEAAGTFEYVVNAGVEALEDFTDSLRNNFGAPEEDEGDVSEQSEPASERSETGGRDNTLQYLYDYINTYGNSMERSLVGDPKVQKYLEENKHLVEAMVTRIFQREAQQM